MIEPGLCGKLTFVGPYTENFRPVMSDLKAAGAIAQVKSAAELEEAIVGYFAGRRQEEFAKIAKSASDAVENRRGTVEKCVAAIRRSIEER